MKAMTKMGIAAALAISAALPGMAAGQVAPVVGYDTPTIRVTGVGEYRAEPNQATAQFGVETAAETAEGAGMQNADRMDRVIQALLAAGVSRDDIQTSDYSLFPQYRQDRRVDGGIEAPEIVGYRATNMVSVRTRALDGIGELIDAALSAGANRLHGVSFSLEDEAAKQAQAEALTRAVADARAQAETMARALGVQLGPVLDASTSSQPIMPVFARMGMERMDVAAAAAPTPIQPGQQTVTATASLVFSIR